MRLLLSGYYGFGNLGDEALLDVMVEQMRRRFPDVVVEVLSAAPQATAARLNVEATQRWDMRAVRAAIVRADVVVSGGGGLMQSSTSLRSLLYYAGIVREAIRLKKRTMIFAQSIGPLDLTGKMIVRRLCRGLDRATVRDARSRTLLASLLPTTNVEQTADPVFLYHGDEEVADLEREGLGSESGPFAVVALRKSSGFAAGVPTIVRAVDRLADVYGIRSAFLVFAGASDAEVSTTVIRACKSAPVLLPELSLPTTAAIFRRAKIAIGMRLHALILAASAAIPFLAIPYDPKVTALTEDLDYPLRPLRQPGNPAPSPESTDMLVDEAIVRHDELSRFLTTRLDGVRRAAARNFDVLGELLYTTP